MPDGRHVSLVAIQRVLFHKLTVEIIDLEDRCSGFGGSTLELRTVDFDKAFRVQEVTEEVTNGVLKLEHGLIGLGL